MAERRRILLVDDVSRWHTVYQSALSDDLNCDVVTAGGGQAALDLLAKEGPMDLMLLDLNMPGLKGDAVLKKLREDKTYEQMPIIIVTGDAASDTQERLLEAGANDFVDKGAPYGVLLARLKAQIRQKDLQDQLTGIAMDLDIFAAGILHDMHNLEHGLVAYCYLLGQKIDEIAAGPDKVEMKTYLVAIEDQLKCLGTYATDVIQAVRASTSEATLVSISWEPVLAWALSAINLTLRGVGSPEVKLKLPKSGWIKTHAREEFMNLVALNILQNAVKYSRAGVPTEVEVTQAEETIGEQKMVVTRFIDNGTGIKKEDIERIFKPFVRAIANSQEKPKGFGMGLALVTKAVRSMKGQVWAEERTDGLPGAVFAVALGPGI